MKDKLGYIEYPALKCSMIKDINYMNLEIASLNSIRMSATFKVLLSYQLDIRKQVLLFYHNFVFLCRVIETSVYNNWEYVFICD